MEQHPLLKALNDWAVPDKKIVGKLEKGGASLDFVGHADITRILIEVDPMWTWEPCDWDNGRPAIHIHKGTVKRGGSNIEVDMATMWGRLTVHGITRVAVGSCEAHKPDLDKELVSDFLRNAAMRFGICLSLWTKQEWEDLTKPEPPKLVAKSDYDKFVKACIDKSIDPDSLLAQIGKPSTELTDADFNKLRTLFKEAVATPVGPAPVAPGGITKAQIRELSLAQGKLSMDHNGLLSIATFTTGRDLRDIVELTSEEAALMIDTLKRDIDKKDS